MTNSNQIQKIACRGIIIDQGQILTVKLKPTDDFYCLPWGKLDMMETLEDCIVREIHEELNILPIVGPMLFVNQWLLKKYNIHMIEFFYIITNGWDFRHVDLTNTSHGFEIYEVHWLDLGNTTTNLLPSFVLEHLQGKTIEQMMDMWTQSVVSH
jgi:8-oxo-dGTP pyrophosphatase MutT (NUDIX family)